MPIAGLMRDSWWLGRKLTRQDRMCNLIISYMSQVAQIGGISSVLTKKLEC